MNIVPSKGGLSKVYLLKEQLPMVIYSESEFSSEHDISRIKKQSIILIVPDIDFMIKNASNKLIILGKTWEI